MLGEQFLTATTSPLLGIVAERVQVNALVAIIQALLSDCGGFAQVLICRTGLSCRGKQMKSLSALAFSARCRA